MIGDGAVSSFIPNDNLQRTERQTDAEGDGTTFTYDRMQRVEAVVDGELRRLESEYDAAGRLFKVYRNLGGTMVKVEEHSYTDNGLKLSVMDARGDLDFRDPSG